MPMNIEALSLELLLGTIEVRARELCQDYANLMAQADANMNVAKCLQDALKRLDVIKRVRKAEAAKRKEREETERRYVRNMERIHRSDEVASLAEKLASLRVQKLRSRKPRQVKFVQRAPEMTEEERDYQRYVGNL